MILRASAVVAMVGLVGGWLVAQMVPTWGAMLAAFAVLSAFMIASWAIVAPKASIGGSRNV